MKVSVITICLNGAEYLAEALQSVADQDYADLEHLVIDGGSTDGSLAIVREFADQHPSLRWWSEKDHGISDAMNRGIEYASGDLVAFLHADDLFASPTVLSEVVEAFSSHPKALWLTAGLQEVDAEGAPMRTLPARHFSEHRLLRNNILFHPATFVRRETLKEVGGFDTALKYAMDYDLWLRLAKLSPPLTLDRIVAKFRVHSGSRSTAERLMALDEEYQVRRRFLSGPFEKLLHWGYQILRRGYERASLCCK
jgi:glycosyltransferase involved in cell wall biosynthesis